MILKKKILKSQKNYLNKNKKILIYKNIFPN